MESQSCLEEFISRWAASGAAERANYQLFLSELCDLLEVPRPEPAQPDNRKNDYVFERSVTFQHGDGNATPNYIDLYKRGCFVLEAKQGSDKVDAPLVPELKRELKKGTAVRGTAGWDKAMQAAKNQAERYAKALPVEDGWPPFLIIVDVGHSIELYSEFTCSGKTYLPFPDPRSHRIQLEDLALPETQKLLHTVWTDPHCLDPAKRSAKVTREVADRLALLAKSLEAEGHSAEKIGNFLKRCLFTMFAEDIGLIPLNCYTELLESLRGATDKYVPIVTSLWQTMKDGGFSLVLKEKLLRFNGGLFEDAEVLPLNEEQLELLILAGKADWKDVEPAIFGTLLERALDPTERHHLGAHYTPREYVERLVLPTVIEPLRADWDAALAAAVSLASDGKQKEAITQLKAFHHKLCNVRVLDPACGSGNFLYVTFEHLKRLEGEVLDALDGFGEKQDLLGLAGVTVDPHQLLGIEVNPRAAAIADMVLWIGYLQWHYRTMGNVQPPEPVIKKFRNIECRDAVLDYDGTALLLDENGQPVTRWDGITTKKHPVTGGQVPDETAQLPALSYLNPRKAQWPEADFVVGNPPFLGKGEKVRQALGPDYVKALRTVRKAVPDSADFVMYWWEHAAELTIAGKLVQFGFITTNSIRQIFNRRVIDRYMNNKIPLSVVFAISDHPWVDSSDGAAVRIAMTVGKKGEVRGLLQVVVEEKKNGNEGIDVNLLDKYGKIHSDLTLGADTASAIPLNANQNITSMGVMLAGSGFIISKEQAMSLGLGATSGLEKHIREYRNGRDLTQAPRGSMVIDLYGLTSDDVFNRYPKVYQWIVDRVKSERDSNRDAGFREKWWLFGRPRPILREMCQELGRYIVTIETSKHRTFSFLPSTVLPDHRLICCGSDDAQILGVLSSRIHVCWALATGGSLEDRPVYNKSRCFETFPFPDASEAQKSSIRDLAEKLDTHRKRQQEEHPKLTMTGMYNVLEKLRNEEPLSTKDKTIYEQGLVSVLKQLHDDLDAAVANAYGWPVDLSDDEVLHRLVDLNRQRTKEERQGLIRWLRPEYQNNTGAGTQTQEAMLEAPSTITAKAKDKRPWPKELSGQMQVVMQALTEHSESVTAKQLANKFMRAREKKVAELLEVLVVMGRAQKVGEDKFAV